MVPLVGRIAAGTPIEALQNKVSDVPVPGGMLIRNAAGLIVGSVGISGDTSENDEVCGVAGIIAAGLVPDTGDPL